MASTSTSSTGGAGSSAELKREERMKRLHALHSKRNEAKQLNHDEVKEEDRRNKQPKNYIERQKRIEWEKDQAKLREECEKEGLEYDRVKLMDVGAEEAEIWNRKKRARIPDEGFGDYEQATIRQYKRLVKNLKPDTEAYEAQKKELGMAVYADTGTLGLATPNDPKDSITALSEDVMKNIQKRTTFRRRRRFDPDADIDYINERNKAFNKKLERFYGEYTAETRQNLERGTAI